MIGMGKKFVIELKDGSSLAIVAQRHTVLVNRLLAAFTSSQNCVTSLSRLLHLLKIIVKCEFFISSLYVKGQFHSPIDNRIYIFPVNILGVLVDRGVRFCPLQH